MFEESWVLDASRRKWTWVVKVFDQLRDERNEAVNAFQNILCFSKIAFSARNGLFMRKCEHVSVKKRIFVLTW